MDNATKPFTTSEVLGTTFLFHNIDSRRLVATTQALDAAQERLSAPAHRHVDGHHINNPVDGCVLCKAIKDRDEARAAFHELRSAWIAEMGCYTLEGVASISDLEAMRKGRRLAMNALSWLDTDP